MDVDCVFGCGEVFLDFVVFCVDYVRCVEEVVLYVFWKISVYGGLIRF